MSERVFWQALSDRAAVMWVEVSTSSGTFVTGPEGFVTWGPLDAEALNVRLSRLSSRRRGYPTWDRESPPSKQELKKKWNATAGSRARFDAEEVEAFAIELVGDADKVDEVVRAEALALLEESLELWMDEEEGSFHRDSGGGSGVVFERRRRGESTDEFYARVGRFYMPAARRTGKPLQVIMTAANVPKGTAAAWVREARGRGFIPPTTRGRSRS